MQRLQRILSADFADSRRFKTRCGSSRGLRVRPEMSESFSGGGECGPGVFSAGSITGKVTMMLEASTGLCPFCNSEPPGPRMQSLESAEGFVRRFRRFAQIQDTLRRLTPAESSSRAFRVVLQRWRWRVRARSVLCGIDHWESDHDAGGLDRVVSFLQSGATRSSDAESGICANLWNLRTRSSADYAEERRFKTRWWLTRAGCSARADCSRGAFTNPSHAVSWIEAPEAQG